MGRTRSSFAAFPGSRKPARLGAMLVLLLLAVAPLSARKETSPSLHVDVQVLTPKGDPLPNAGVVLQQISDLRGKKVKDALDVELKTDQHGKTGLDGFVEGKILVQVIAAGMRTFGKVYTIRKDQASIVVHMQYPTSQYSIYH